jgi:hypothetical protein
MKAIEYRKQAERQAAQDGTNLMGVISKMVGKMTNDELIALGVELNHRRLTKTAQRISTEVGHDQRMSRSSAEAIAVSEILAAVEA